MGNPISLVDADGMKVDSASRHEWDSQKQAITDQRNDLSQGVTDLNALSKATGADLSGLINGLTDRVTSLTGTLTNLTNLENSSQMYGLNSTPGQTGSTTLNTSTHTIVFSFGNTANFVHETTHGGQFESGEIAFRSDGRPIGEDVQNEVSAYKAQFAFDPKSVSGLTSSSVANSFGSITTTWVQGLTTSGGDRPYAQGGTFNTGISPVNINSTREDLIRAYPGQAAQLQTLPANFILKSIPGLYYKH
jgi:hypothetical protein